MTAWRCLTCTREGSGRAPAECPDCYTRVGWGGNGDGPHPSAYTERVPHGIGWRLIGSAPKEDGCAWDTSPGPDGDG